MYGLAKLLIEFLLNSLTMIIFYLQRICLLKVISTSLLISTAKIYRLTSLSKFR